LDLTYLGTPCPWTCCPCTPFGCTDLPLVPFLPKLLGCGLPHSYHLHPIPMPLTCTCAPLCMGQHQDGSPSSCLLLGSLDMPFLFCIINACPFCLLPWMDLALLPVYCITPYGTMPLEQTPVPHHTLPPAHYPSHLGVTVGPGHAPGLFFGEPPCPPVLPVLLRLDSCLACSPVGSLTPACQFTSHLL